MGDLVAWSALAVSVVSAGTSVWALAETYRSRPRPVIEVRWQRRNMDFSKSEPVAAVILTNQSEGRALDVRVRVSSAIDSLQEEWWSISMLGPAEEGRFDVPLYQAERVPTAHGISYRPLLEGVAERGSALLQPEVIVRWRQEPNTRRIRSRRFVAPAAFVASYRQYS